MSDTSDSTCTLIGSRPSSPPPRKLSRPPRSKPRSPDVLSSPSRSPDTSKITAVSSSKIRPCPWLKDPTLADRVYLHYTIGRLAIESPRGPAKEHALAVTRSPPGYVPAGQSFARATTTDLSGITQNLAAMQRQNVPAYWQHRCEASLSLQQLIDVTATGRALLRQAEIYRGFASQFLHLCMVRRICNQDTSTALQVWDWMSYVASWTHMWNALVGFDDFELAVSRLGIPHDWLKPLETIVRDIEGLRLPEQRAPAVHWELHCPWPVPVGRQGDGKGWDREAVERATWTVVRRLCKDGWGYREILELTDIELEGLGIGPSWRQYFRTCVEDLRRGKISLVIPAERVRKQGSFSKAG